MSDPFMVVLATIQAKSKKSTVPAINRVYSHSMYEVYNFPNSKVKSFNFNNYAKMSKNELTKLVVKINLNHHKKNKK
jgi:hypothetical protein